MDTRKASVDSEVKPLTQDNNPQVIIKKEIADFKKKLKALQDADHRTMHMSLGTIALMLLSSGYSAAFGVAILGYLTNEYALPVTFPRKGDLIEEYTKQLNKLTNIYVNYCKSGPAVTTDEDFLELLETLSPFLWDRVLFPENMRTIEANKLLSEKFRKILSAPPHNLFIPVLKDSMVEKPIVNTDANKKNDNNQNGFFYWVTKYDNQESKTTLPTVAIVNKKEEKPHYPAAQKAASLFGIFGKPITELRRFCYGYSSEKEVDEILNHKANG